MQNFRTYGVNKSEISDREQKHRELARRVAAEGMVILKNDNILPLKPSKIALYGAGGRMTVRGGTGSGDVHERYNVNIEDGLENAGFEITSKDWLDRFSGKYTADKEAWRAGVEEKIKGFGPAETMQMFDIIHENVLPYPSASEIVESDLTMETDTAIYVVARQAGESFDRRLEENQFLLTQIEKENIKKLAEHYDKVILVINCGGIMDLAILDEVNNIGAVIYFVQAGTEGGNAFADLVTGRVTPSGRLTDTWGMDYYDYPSAETYSHINGEVSYENYYEGIYVGYRWFDAKKIKARYPFGYGLSYTTFEQELVTIQSSGTTIELVVKVTNTGKTYTGKDVVQVYASKPQHTLDTEVKSLVAFAKTSALEPGNSEELTLRFDAKDLAVYMSDENAFILLAGDYLLALGQHAEKVTAAACILVEKDFVIEQVKAVNPKALDFKDFVSEYRKQEIPENLPSLVLNLDSFETKHSIYQTVEPQASSKVENLIATLSDQELAKVCVGGGYALDAYNRLPGAAGMTSVDLLDKDIPNIILCDGPAGLNVTAETAYTQNGELRYPNGLPEHQNWGYLKDMNAYVTANPAEDTMYYRYMTAWPCSTLQAQTWNIDLLEEVGRAVGREMVEIGVTVWLAPGLNLHRNPLCGRNFEYYSEDPLISGKMAAAITRGVQEHSGCSVTIKHFCCNNQEDNRDYMSSNVSQRALRELYLKGFRIAVEEGHPQALMTSYNMVNGTYTPNSPDLIENVLRSEWGYQGLVMSDWNSTDKCSHVAAINAGNDLLMPGNDSVYQALVAGLEDGNLDRDALKRSAKRILRLIFDSNVVEGF